MQNIGEQLGYSALENYRAHPSLVTADAVGVELELEGLTSGDVGVAQRHLNPHWTVTTDGSLRNGGVEFITTGGKGGEVLYQAYERITTLLRDTVNYDASWRCSTHMHLNMLDFTCNQVARYMLVYAACEPVLFALAGSQRRSSNFCTPLADSLVFHKKLISRLYDNTVANRLASAQTSKYTALNFQPLFGNQNVRPLGTIEFRGGRPMTTMDELLLQTNILLSIKDFVRNFEGTEDEMLVKLNDGVFNTVFQNGCASSLDYVKVEELEAALIHSWLLLKSYQEGMKTQPSESASRGFGSGQAATATDWAQLTAQAEIVRRRGAHRPAIAIHDDVEGDRPYWSASLVPRDGLRITGDNFSSEELARLHPEFSPNNWPIFHRHLEEIQQSVTPRTRKAELMARILCDERFIFRMSPMSCRTTVMNWVLKGGDVETTPVGTIIRAALNRILPGRARQVECVDNGSSTSNQPVTMAVSTNVDYTLVLNTVQLSQLSNLFQMPRQFINNRYLFQTMMNTMVQLRNKSVLCANYRVRTGVAISDYLPDNIPAAMAYTLFRIANVQSFQHLSANTLRDYDAVCAAMNIFLAVGLSFPVIFRWIERGDARTTRRLYMVSTRSHQLGFPCRMEQAANHQTHEPRVSVTSGQRVY
jgi:hypothetical protein